jgi:hypothetical protein
MVPALLVPLPAAAAEPALLPVLPPLTAADMPAAARAGVAAVVARVPVLLPLAALLALGSVATLCSAVGAMAAPGSFPPPHAARNDNRAAW